MPSMSDLADAHSLGCEHALDEFGARDNPYDPETDKRRYDEYEEGFNSIGPDDFPSWEE